MAYLGAKPDAFQYTSTSSQSLSGDGVTTTFTLNRQVSANADIEVVVNNVPQEPGFAYYVSDLTNLIFTAAPSAAANNIYIIYRNYVQSGIAPGANTVTTSAIAANTIQPWQLTNSLLNPIVNTFTANGTGTTYTLSFAPPSANAVVVTVNGITQNHPENYSTNDTVLTFTDPPASNSVIRVLQQAMIGTSIVPIDGSVTTSKLASGLTLSGTTTINTLVSSGANLSGGSINNMTIGGTTANTGAFTTLSATGVATFSAGSNTAPAITTSDDTNTGIFFPAADTIAFTEGGTEVMRIDSSSRVGIGATPSVGGTKLTVVGGGVQLSGGTTSQEGIRIQRASGYASITGINNDNNAYNALAFFTGATEAMRIDSSGRLLVGNTTSNNLPYVGSQFAPGFQNYATSGTGGFYRYSADSDPSVFTFTKSRNATIGSQTIVNNGDNLGYIGFAGSDGTNFITAASIVGMVDGVPGTNDMPGRLVFTTTADGASSPTERMRIDSSGNLGIGTSSPQMRVDVSGGVRVQSISNPSSGSGMELAYDGTQGIIQAYSNRATLASVPVYLVTGQLKFPPTQNPSADANTLDDYEEGTWTPDLRFGNATTGITYSSRAGRYTKIGNCVYYTMRINLSSKGSATGAAQIYGLPFPVGNSGSVADYAGATLGYSDATSGWNVTLQLTLDQSQSYIVFRYNNGTNNVGFTQANFANNTDVILNGFYFA